jgi:acetyltransferase-like isoleucine patch superfamily enzyme
MRRFARKVRDELYALRSPKRTALRTAPDRRPLPAYAFRRYGKRSFVVPPSRITGVDGIEIGDDVILLEDCALQVDSARGARLVIGDGTRLAVGVEIVCTIGVTIEPAVSTSDYATVTDSWALLAHPAGNPPPPGAPVVIGAGAYLGWGSVIGPGVTVGAGAFIGEGAVVLDDVAPHTVVYGNPATVVRHLDPVTRRWSGPQLP